METFVSFLFALASLAVIVLFLPEIIGLGVVLLAMFYVVSFVGGISAGKK